MTEGDAKIVEENTVRSPSPVRDLTAEEIDAVAGGGRYVTSTGRLVDSGGPAE
jgi:hypothetical protein